MDDFEETARLVLMDLTSRSLAIFGRGLREYYSTVDPVTICDLWDKYMGRDGRVFATHNLETGEPL